MSNVTATTVTGILSGGMMAFLPLVFLVITVIVNMMARGKETQTEDKMDDEDKTTCDKCGKEIYDDDEITCDECEDICCLDCVIRFENSSDICKECIDKEYPREKEVQKEYVEKIVEIEARPRDSKRFD